MKGTGARARSLVKAHVTGRPASAAQLTARIKAGLPPAEFDAMRDLLGVTVEYLAAKVGISTATLSRRRRSGQPLDASHSDRLLRLARLFRLPTELYDGDAGAARAWLHKPAPALDGETPLDHAETEAGGREVEDLIGRLEHGVYA